MRRTIATALLGVLAVVLPLAGRANAATSDSSAAMEQQFVAKINDLRASKGLRPLAVDTLLTSIGRQWAAHMAAAGAISHNPNLASQVTENWTKLGENVGSGRDVDNLFSAFVNSAHHYANLV